MTHLETELQEIKNSSLEMMRMVKMQISKGKEALISYNRELALEVMHTEKRVNGYDIMIDTHCENVIARFNPVAVDLRFLLATLKINYHLERMGDNAEGIARNVIELKDRWNKELFEKTKLAESFDEAISMLDLIISSYENEDTEVARKLFDRDKKIDTICNNALVVIADYLKTNQQSTEEDLYLLLIHRKLERVGDLLKNIAEEIIFFIEAKVLKHRKSRGEV